MVLETAGTQSCRVGGIRMINFLGVAAVVGVLVTEIPRQDPSQALELQGQC